MHGTEEKKEDIFIRRRKRDEREGERRGARIWKMEKVSKERRISFSKAFLICVGEAVPREAKRKSVSHRRSLP